MVLIGPPKPGPYAQATERHYGGSGRRSFTHSFSLPRKRVGWLCTVECGCRLFFVHGIALQAQRAIARHIVVAITELATHCDRFIGHACRLSVDLDCWPQS